MKKLFLTGNLTKDVEVKKVKVKDEEVSVATLSLAVNEVGAEEVTFLDVEVWRGQADNCAKFLSKGSTVSVIADIKNKNYEKDGIKIYTYKFTAEEVQFVSSKKEK